MRRTNDNKKAIMHALKASYELFMDFNTKYTKAMAESSISNG
jgi:hypothetical protein